MIFMETERLVLRSVRAQDADTMFDYRNNETCARYQRGQTKDYEGIKMLVQQRHNDVLSHEDNCMIAVALKATGEMIGEIIVMPSENTFSFGYTFSYKHHRKGYAYEALSALHAYLHAQYPAWEFICFTEKNNVPSMALLKKLGYRDMGYLPKRDSRIFGMYTTRETDKEVAALVSPEE